MDKHSYLSNADGAVIEDYYQKYLKDPEDVGEGWRKFFEGFEFARKNYDTDVPEGFDKEFKVIDLINGYRKRGHLFTKTNPVRTRRQYSPNLDIENYGLEKSDLETVFQAGNEIGIGSAKLKDIIAHLEETYCESIGIEYMYIRKPEEVAWLREKIELKNRAKFDNEDKKHILHKLNQAVVFEQFLHKKFVGQKRFSLEGNEALIPALDAVIEKGSEFGIQEFIVGMAHRGRLNVLANIFNKTYSAIFSEFEGKEYEDNIFDGDVKYHLGYSCDLVADNGKKVHMTLSPNPSHLETVAPVVGGIGGALTSEEGSSVGEVLKNVGFGAAGSIPGVGKFTGVGEQLLDKGLDIADVETASEKHREQQWETNPDRQRKLEEGDAKVNQVLGAVNQAVSLGSDINKGIKGAQ
ncbi:MAG: hypothetical protein HRT73_00225 [Flavobacteriales bacterium]|nr:hypothetical protein [Flavobacteriales bacterium]